MTAFREWIGRVDLGDLAMWVLLVLLLMGLLLAWLESIEMKGRDDNDNDE